MGGEAPLAAARRRAGAAGEAAALAHLEALGYRVLAADWRCRLGQLDLVVLDGDCLVAVEVKARRGIRFGLPQEAVDGRKQRKLRGLLDAYRQACGRLDQPCRIDVLAVQLDARMRAVACEHLVDAVPGR